MPLEKIFANRPCAIAKGGADHLPLKENTLYYEKTEPIRSSQAEVADYQVELTEEGQDLTLFAKETLDQLTKPAKLHFAERKPANYDQLDHPELDLASLDKAYDKLEREESSSFPELEFSGKCMEPISLPKGGMAFIS